MSQEYKKVPQLPAGLDLQGNVLLGGEASGKNWVVADGMEYRKRPGLRPVLALPAPDDTAAGSSYVLRAPRGVLAASEYVIGNQPRLSGAEQLTGNTDAIIASCTSQIVCIVDGRPFSIKKFPVLVLQTVLGAFYPSYRFSTNPTTGVLEFALRNSTTGLEAVYTVTAGSTLADIVAAFPGELTTVDTSYTRNSATSTLPGVSALLATCIAQTAGSRWENLDPVNSFIYGYVLSEVPLSSPTDDGTVYRVFYSRDIAGTDSNITVAQFQEELLFAGRWDALMSFDGYRMSVAGCNTIQVASFGLVAATGNLVFGGVYNYRLRTKTIKPSGQITYGPYFDTEVTNSLGASSACVIHVPAYYPLDTQGTNYSDVAYSPRRINTMTETSVVVTPPNLTISGADSRAISPQVGEYVGISSLVPATNYNQMYRYLIDSVTAAGDGQIVLTTSVEYAYASPAGIVDRTMSLGEELEIYRTAASGSVYYLLATIPFRGTFTDTISDASLVSNPPYLGKTYAIRRPPDCCIAVTEHQTRIVVVGEYINSYIDSSQNEGISPDIHDTVTNSNQPFIRNVYWSQPSNEEFSPTNNATLDIAQGGELNSCISVMDTLYIGGGESMWAIQGNLASATSYTVNRIAGAGGTVGNTAVTALNGQVYAVSRSGLYALNGGAADYTIGGPVNAIIRSTKKELLPFIRLTTDKGNSGLRLVIPGMVFERAGVKTASAAEVFPSSFIATEDAADTVTFVFDPNTQKWSMWSGVDMYMGGGLVDFDGMTWAFPRKDGKPICVLDNNYGYDGFTSPVEMVIKGPWQTDGDIFTDKSFVRLRVISAAGERQNFVLRTKIERNWNANQAWQECDIAFRSGAGYGQLPYGNYPYGDPNEPMQQVALTNQKALSVRAVFENSDPAEFPSITGWNFEVGENRKNMKQE